MEALFRYDQRSASGREPRRPSFSASWLGRGSNDFESRGGDSEDDDEEEEGGGRGRQTLVFHATALVVGILAGAMACAYNLVLRHLIRLGWVWIPRWLGSGCPWWYAIAACGTTGLVVSLLGECVPSPSNVDEWIDSVHRPLTAPSPTPKNFAPMIVLTTLTAAGGISVGPEAPMVVLGGTMGAALARVWFGTSDAHAVRVLSLAGGGAALSAFFSMPLAGAIFALETPHDGVSGMQYFEALSPAAIASVAALFTRCILLQEPLRGKYTYGQEQQESPLADLAMSLGCGLAGGLLAVALTGIFRWSKWAGAAATTAGERGCACGKERDGGGDEDSGGCGGRRELRGVLARLALRVATGAAIGAVGVLFPHSLFWGDEQLQSIIDDGRTPLKWLWRSSALDRFAVVKSEGEHISHEAALGLALAKTLAIALSLGGAFPGGIIYPLFVVGAASARAMQRVVAHSRSSALTLCMMASTQSAVTRTPISTALILIVTARSFDGDAGGSVRPAVMPVVFPLLVISVVIAMLVSNFFTPVRYYGKQRQRVGVKRLFKEREDHGGGGGASRRPSMAGSRVPSAAAYEPLSDV